jgi:hypothetical protein
VHGIPFGVGGLHRENTLRARARSLGRTGGIIPRMVRGTSLTCGPERVEGVRFPYPTHNRTAEVLTFRGFILATDRLANYQAKIRPYGGTGSPPDHSPPIVQHKLALMYRKVQRAFDG